MTKKILLITITTINLLSAQIIQPGRFALKLDAGTLGFGGELVVSVVEKLNVRAGLNTFTFPYTYEDTDQEMEADIDLTLSSISVLADFYPGKKSSFHLTSGLLINNNAVDMTITPTGTYEVGVKTFSSDEIGILDGVVDFAKVNPYIGLGWGKATNPDKRVGFNFDLGVIYQNSPNVDFEATGMIEGSADQDVVFEESLQDLKFFPVMKLGLSVRLY
jgi:hypothetical protein